MKLWICLMMLFSSAAAIDMSGKMLVFPVQTNTAHVRLMTTLNNFNLKALSVCHRSFTDLARSHGIFSMATKLHENKFLTFWDEAQKMISLSLDQTEVGYKNLNYTPNRWHSICASWDNTTGLVQMWFNGQSLTKKFSSAPAIVNELPIIILGQDQDTYGGGFDEQQSFVGMITDVHMWDYVVPSCEVHKFMKEESHTPGNVINWGNVNLQSTGRVLTLDREVLCTVKYPA